MNYEQMNNNRVFLKGIVMSNPIFSHDTYGEAYYDVKLAVSRLSNANDEIPITVSEKLLSTGDFAVGKEVSIKGQYRSYNKQEEGKSKLMLTVFVREIDEFPDDMITNQIELTGYICKPPVYRMTPFKREITDMLLAVNRAYNKSDYLPCIAWGRNARYIKDMEVGEKVSIVGRIQSREYQKKLEDGTVINKTAYEISVSKIQPEKDNDLAM